MNDSLIEIALREMKAKRKPRTLAKIAKDVFEIKGIPSTDSDNIMSQFEIDFMLSGYFICCGEDKNGSKLWDLKNRQPSSLLDKDGNYLEDLYSDDEEVVKNELKDDIVYKPALDKDFDEEYEADINEEEDDDEEEETEETDEIEEELMAEIDDDLPSDKTEDVNEEFDDEEGGDEEDIDYNEDDEPLEDEFDDDDISDYEDKEDDGDKAI